MNKKKTKPIGSLLSAGRLGLAVIPLGLLLATAFGTQAYAMTLKVQGAVPPGSNVSPASIST